MLPSLPLRKDTRLNLVVVLRIEPPGWIVRITECCGKGMTVLPFPFVPVCRVFVRAQGIPEFRGIAETSTNSPEARMLSAAALLSLDLSEASQRNVLVTKMAQRALGLPAGPGMTCRYFNALRSAPKLMW
jgi:hypothetical protein